MGSARPERGAMKFLRGLVAYLSAPVEAERKSHWTGNSRNVGVPLFRLARSDKSMRSCELTFVDEALTTHW